RGGLGVPPLIEAATAQYRADQDPLRDFYAQCGVFEEQAWAASAALYPAHQAWTRENGVRQNQVLSSTAVGRRLRARGCLQKPGEIADDMGKRKKARGWTGLRLRTEADAEADDSTTDEADEPGPDGDVRTADERPEPDVRSEQEHVGTPTSGSCPSTRARGKNKYEDRVPPRSDPLLSGA